ncbi:MAG: hypothetical protein F6K30_07970 [Cyanothece sp. SIO2G6]|nr:hypothetical protein [Cyanothece sp. SIO2G6]
MPQISSRIQAIRIAFSTVLLAICFWGSLLGISPVAQALPSFKISDLSYEECPDIAKYEGLTTSWGGGDAKCVMIHGKAKNETNKLIVNADVFGRIYDANGNSLMENRGRLGGIDEVPPGITDFEIRISVPEEQSFPLRLEKFKGSGFTGRVRR